MAVSPHDGDVSPWTTHHAAAVMADGAAAGRPTVEPFVITKRIDVSSP